MADASPLLPRVDSDTKPPQTVPLWKSLLFTIIQAVADMAGSIPMLLPLFKGLKCPYIPSIFTYMWVFVILNLFLALLLLTNNLYRAFKGPYKFRRDVDNTDVGLVYPGYTFVRWARKIALPLMLLTGLVCVWGGGLSFSNLNLLKHPEPTCDPLAYKMVLLSTGIVYAIVGLIIISIVIYVLLIACGVVKKPEKK